MQHFLKLLPLKNRLLTPLYTSFLFLVLLAIAQAYLNILLEADYQRAAAQVNRSLLIERETERLFGAVVDEQTSVRGYLLTQDQTFLEPYRTKARTIFQNSLNQLHILVQGQPLQIAQLQQIKAIYDDWQKHFVLKVISGTANRTTLPGKILFDPMRLRIAKLLEYEDKILAQRQQKFHQLSQMKTVLDLCNLIIILACVGGNFWLLRQRVELPLRKLTETGEAWREGKLEVRLDYSSPDEIGQLAAVLDAMAREIRDREQHMHSRNHQLEDMISALSHDLRTPLIAMQKTLPPMLNGAFGEINDTWKEILQEFDQSNENLLKLVNTLLDVSRYQAGGSQNLDWQPLDWQKIFTQAINQIAPSQPRCCPVCCDIPESLPTVYGDSLEIQRVIQNLIDNAMRVSEPKTPITIEVTCCQDEHIKVAVCDQGPGIAPQEKEKLFHRFIQGRGRRGGAGLGLYLCRQIIEAHGGTIDVESTLGEGSTFWFILPARHPSMN